LALPKLWPAREDPGTPQKLRGQGGDDSEFNLITLRNFCLQTNITQA
jgi:hypothetical protein